MEIEGSATVIESSATAILTFVTLGVVRETGRVDYGCLGDGPVATVRVFCAAEGAVIT